MPMNSHRSDVSALTQHFNEEDNEEYSLMTDDASLNSTMPDFQSVHNTYTRGLLKGRHPRSFPRQSELWHHYKSSSKRLERVTKGHKLWSVIAESEEDVHATASKMNTELNQQKRNTSSKYSEVGSSYIPKEPLHGLHVDLKGSFRMHYGMNIVLMNSLDEVLCVNQHHEVMCKTEDQLEYGDEICFKLIDLTEPTNPGPIAYGKPVWLQALRSEGDNSIYYGFVVGAKLFGPPEMKSEKFFEYTKRKSAKPSESEKKSPQTSNVTPYGSPVSEKGDTSPEDSNGMMESTMLTEVPPSTGEAMGSKETRTSEASGADNLPSKYSRKKNTDKAELKKKKSGKSTEQAEICGALGTLQAFSGSKDEKSYGMHQHQLHQQQQTQGDDQTRFKSRQASHLAMWTVQSALKSGAPEKFVTSCTPIYLEQDLYCLATSHGNTYNPWPRTVEVDIVSAGISRKQMIKQQQALASKKNTLFDTLNSFQSAYSPGGHETDAFNSTSTSTASAASVDTTTQPAKALTTFTHSLPHGCLRRVVKRGAPYEHLVDRRCVWKFCVVDNPRDLKLLSVKEQRAQKLLRKARAGLNKSKHNRLGGRVHEGYVLPDGETLTGGEKFPTMLRTIVSTTTLRMETDDMISRRQKEEDIASHIKDMFRGCNVDEIEKYADGTLSVSSSAKMRRKKSERDISTPGSPDPRAQKGSGFAASTRGPRRAEINRLRSKPEKAVDESAPRDLKNFSFGGEMLKIHQSFAAVNAKVTGSLMTRNYMNSYEGGKYQTQSVSDKSNSGSPVGSESTFPSLSNSSISNSNPSLGRLSHKMELLAQEDQRVLLALRHREQMSKRTDIGSLFDDLVGEDIYSKNSQKKHHFSSG
eukprot:CAMPEP_0185026632 /NCGR_PEP_ID=MMETSP1103-20130426/10970_1 /TAXON_ID=36769 /ORGANISM="Paraphysomonas bandaiensis, Strain Caron Lab Isolate" /LENGTH=863 /DNA_ID=CAMNT_0027560281 /DNA_START=92 /DNA_END=2683 /DNA_ORIENTATION=-